MNWRLLANSFGVGAATTVLALSAGLCAALAACSLEARGRRALLIAAAVVILLPPFLVVDSWLYYFAVMGLWRGAFTLELFSMAGAVLILGFCLWPIPFLFLLAAWQRVPKELLEIDPRLRGWRLLRWLLLPEGRSALTTSAMLVFVFALGNFAVPALLQTKVYPAEMWIRFTTKLDAWGALLLSLPLVLAPILLWLALRKRDVSWPWDTVLEPHELLRKRLGKGWLVATAFLTSLLLLLSLVAPLGRILFSAGTWRELGPALAAGWTSLWTSFCLAAGAAVATIFLGGMLYRARWRSILWFPFLFPGTLLGIILIALLNHSWSDAIYQSTLISLIALVIRYAVLPTITFSHALSRVDRDLTDVARLAGANRWQMWRQVYWPQISRPVLVCGYLVYLLCLWDVESIVLIHPPGGETLALRIFNLLHYGHNAQVNALCLALLGLGIAPLAGWSLLRVWKGTQRPTRAGLALGVALITLSGCAPGSGNSADRISSAWFDRAVIVSSRGAGVGEVNKPRSVTVDTEDNLYVADMTGRIQKFSPQGRFLLSWQMPQTEKGQPKGLCCDRDGWIVVNEPHYSRVNHFTPEGKLMKQWGTHGSKDGELAFPRAVAVNSRNEIFVSEYGIVERVQLFAPDRKTLVRRIGRAGNGPGEFNRPEGLGVDAQDQLYVADSCNHRIQVFSSDGTFLHAYGQAGSGVGELSYPYDICIDTDGRQYVCEFGNSRIQVFSPEGKSLEIIGGPGARPGRFNNPWGVALDHQGNLYVADSLNHRVQKLVRKRSEGVP